MISRMIGLNNKSAMTLLIGALLLTGVLGGCSDVFVKVDTSCPPATGTRVLTVGTQPEVDGACFVGSSYNGQAAGFWHMALKRTITAGEDFNCVGPSKKCPGTPGTCTGGTCKSRYYPLTATTGSCNCGCVY
jgi:hypothetical protein